MLAEWSLFSTGMRSTYVQCNFGMLLLKLDEVILCTDSLVPRAHGRRESSLVLTACTCMPIPRESVYVCKLLVK